jgi:guanylate kinase
MMDKSIKPIVISGPSGVGKSTIIATLLKNNPQLWLSVSHNTRVARPGEVEGFDYYFVSKKEFLDKIESDDFFEWVEVYGTFKGTPKKELINKIDEGKTPILELEHIGAFAVKKEIPEAVLVYILPPSKEEHFKRLFGRHDPNMSDLEMDLRVKAIENEISMSSKYDYVFVNNNVDEVVEEIEKLLYY